MGCPRGWFDGVGEGLDLSFLVTRFAVGVSRWVLVVNHLTILREMSTWGLSAIYDTPRFV